MEYKFTALDDVEVKADARTVRGYASVFGNVDSYGDTIVKGAYAATIKANKTGLPMLWQHNTDNLIGRWTSMKEDDKGLLVEGRLTPGHRVAEDVYASLKNGDVDGISIGFSIPPGGASERGDGVRVLKKIDLFEASIVVMPADRNALISATKASDEKVAQAIDALAKAIKLHEGHMDGSIPTDDASQMKMMALMKKALTALGGEAPSSMDGMGKALRPYQTERQFERLLIGAMREADVQFSRSDAVALLRGGFKELTATRDAGGRHEPEALKSALLDAIRNARA